MNRPTGGKGASSCPEETDPINKYTGPSQPLCIHQPKRYSALCYPSAEWWGSSASVAECPLFFSQFGVIHTKLFLVQVPLTQRLHGTRQPTKEALEDVGDEALL